MDPEAEADGPAQATFLLLVAILVVGELGWKFSLEGRLEDLFRAHGGKAEVAQDLFHGAERVPEAVRGQLDQARQRSEAEEKGKGKKRRKPGAKEGRRGNPYNPAGGDADADAGVHAALAEQAAAHAGGGAGGERGPALRGEAGGADAGGGGAPAGKGPGGGPAEGGDGLAEFEMLPCEALNGTVVTRHKCKRAASKAKRQERLRAIMDETVGAGTMKEREQSKTMARYKQKQLELEAELNNGTYVEFNETEWRETMFTLKDEITRDIDFHEFFHGHKSVFVTQENFHATHNKDRDKFPSEEEILVPLDPEYRPFFPEDGRHDSHFKRCAIVGNSRSLLSKEYGAEINQYDAVLRINQAPTLGGLELHVGKKTTFRMVNHKWTIAYAGGNPKLQLENDTTLIVSRTSWQEFVEAGIFLNETRPDVRLKLLSRPTVDRAGGLLRKLRENLEKFRPRRYPGKGSPSSGFIAIFLLMQICDDIGVYGIGDGVAIDGLSSWHYFEGKVFTGTREFGVDPHHSWELEMDVYALLEDMGIIRLHKIVSDMLHERMVFSRYTNVTLKHVVPIWPPRSGRTSKQRTSLERKFKLRKKLKQEAEEERQRAAAEALAGHGIYEDVAERQRQREAALLKKQAELKKEAHEEQRWRKKVGHGIAAALLREARGG